MTQSDIGKMDFSSIEAANASIERACLGSQHIIMSEEPAGQYFGDDLYVREFRAKKGQFIVGKVHLTNHVFVMISGKMVSWTRDEGLGVIQAPFIFEGKAGSQRVLFVLEDMHIVTSHGLPGIYDIQPDREKMKELITLTHYEDFVKQQNLKWDSELKTFVDAS